MFPYVSDSHTWCMAPLFLKGLQELTLQKLISLCVKDPLGSNWVVHPKDSVWEDWGTLGNIRED